MLTHVSPRPWVPSLVGHTRRWVPLPMGHACQRVPSPVGPLTRGSPHPWVPSPLRSLCKNLFSVGHLHPRVPLAMGCACPWDPSPMGPIITRWSSWLWVVLTHGILHPWVPSSVCPLARGSSHPWILLFLGRGHPWDPVVHGRPHPWVSRGGAMARGASWYLVAPLMVFSVFPTGDANPRQVLKGARINPRSAQIGL